MPLLLPGLEQNIGHLINFDVDFKHNKKNICTQK